MHKQKELLYSFDALEPYIDAKTMEIHFTKHHVGYINKLNNALKDHPDTASLELEDLLKNVNSLDPNIKQAVINHGGGHHNHTLFWEAMSPKPKDPSGKFLESLESKFGSLQDFKDQFIANAASVFGSGWGYLVLDSNSNLELIKTPNQDSPLMQGKTPLLGVDVWEHAYYLKYQNKRPDYLDAFMKVLDLSVVEDRFNKNY